jgi:hypothetical protein
MHNWKQKRPLVGLENGGKVLGWEMEWQWQGWNGKKWLAEMVGVVGLAIGWRIRLGSAGGGWFVAGCELVLTGKAGGPCDGGGDRGDGKKYTRPER